VNSTVAAPPDPPSGESAAALQARIEYERVAKIYELTHIPMLAAAVFAVMLSLALWNEVDRRWLLLWAGARLAVCVWRSLEAWLFFRDRQRQTRPGWVAHWRHRFLGLMVLEAVMWAAMGILFVPATQGVMSLLVDAAVFAAAGAAVFTLTSYFPAAVVALLLGVVPFGLHQAWLAPHHALTVVLAMATFVALMLFESWRSQLRWLENMRLRFHAQALARAHASALTQAQQASAAKSQFLANMSHEIRTPLGAMMGLSELLLEGELTAAQRRYLDLSQASAQHLLRLVDEVLDFSKVQAGGLTLETAVYSPGRLCEALIATLAPRAQAKGLRLLLHVAKEPGQTLPDQLLGDATRLTQVLTNLVGNAIKFTERGEVALQVRRLERPPHTLQGPGAPETSEQPVRLHFEVRDTGVGIPAGLQQHVLQPFAQADASTARRHGGTGLGLSISAALVRLMGSELALHSEVGVGSRFWFELEQREPLPDPVRRPSEPASPAPLVTTAQRPQLHGRVVLVAEDNDINALILTEMVSRCGAQVLRVRTGAEVLALIDRTRLDLILMDVQMPDIDGLHATRALRERERVLGLLALPVVAVTANAMASDRVACLEAGMTAYLTKPVFTHALFGVLTQFLGESVAADAAAMAAQASSKASAANTALPPNGPDYDPAVLASLPMVADRSRPGFVQELLQLAAERFMPLVHEAGGESAAAARALHTLKSAAAQVGALRLAALAAELEPKARALPAGARLEDQSPLEVHALAAALRAFESQAGISSQPG
jgi:two-component system, sensor histidine kinase